MKKSLNLTSSRSFGKLFAVFAMAMMVFGVGGAQKYKGVSNKQVGFGNFTELGANIPFEKYAVGFGGQSVFGTYLNPQMYFGGGLGLEAFDNDVFVPIVADYRYFWSTGDVQPFMVLDAGYGINVNDMSGSAMVYSPGIGFRFFMTPSFAVHGLFAYRGMYFHGDETATSFGQKHIGFITVRGGFSF